MMNPANFNFLCKINLEMLISQHGSKQKSVHSLVKSIMGLLEINIEPLFHTKFGEFR